MMNVLKDWIFTTDHKKIGLLYLIGSIAAFALAGVMALLMRTELSTMGPTITNNPGDYNVWLYFHGAAMILGFQIPALIISTPCSFIRWVVSSSCSSVSALHGPAIIAGFFIPTPQSPNDSIFIFFLLFII